MSAAQKEVLKGTITLAEYRQKLIAITATAKTGDEALATSFAKIKSEVDGANKEIEKYARNLEKAASVKLNTPTLPPLSSSSSPAYGGQRTSPSFTPATVNAVNDLTDAEKRLAAAQKATAEAKAAETRAFQSELPILQKEIEIKQQAIAGSIKYAEAQRQLAVLQASQRFSDSGQAQAIGNAKAQLEGLNTSFNKLKDAKSTTERLNEAIGKLGHSLRRIAEIATGISLVSLLGRTIGEGFAAIKDSFNVSADLEKNKIGIAALLQGTTQLKDGFGNLISGTEAWSINLAEAKKQQAEIAKISTETLGTNIELQDVYRTALAFSRGQHASLSDILKLSQGITNVGKLQGLEATRLTDETRQILQLETNRGQTILAQLGISLQQAREYKSQGILVQKLNEGLSAYNALAKESALTFEGLTTSVKTFAGLFQASVFAPTFDAVKQVFIGARDELDKLRQSGGIAAAIGANNDDLQKLGRAIADGFAIIQVSLGSLANTLIILGSAFANAADSPKTLQKSLDNVNDSVEKFRDIMLTTIRDVAAAIENNHGAIQAFLALLSSAALASGHPILATGLFTAAVSVPSADSAKTARTNAQEQLNLLDATKRYNSALADQATYVKALQDSDIDASKEIDRYVRLLSSGAEEGLKLSDRNKEIAESFGLITDRVKLTAPTLAQFYKDIQAPLLPSPNLTREGSPIDASQTDFEKLKKKAEEATLEIQRFYAEQTGKSVEYEKRMNDLIIEDFEDQVKHLGKLSPVGEKQLKDFRAVLLERGQEKVLQETEKGLQKVLSQDLANAKARQDAAKATADVQQSAAQTALIAAQTEFDKVKDLADADEERIVALTRLKEAQQGVSTATVASLQQEIAAARENAGIVQKTIDARVKERDVLLDTLNRLPENANPEVKVGTEGQIALLNKAIDEGKQKIAAFQAVIQVNNQKIIEQQASGVQQQVAGQKQIADQDRANADARINARKQELELIKAGQEIEKAQIESKSSGLGDKKDLLEAEISLLKQQGASDAVIAAKELQILDILRQQIQLRIQSAQIEVAQAQAAKSLADEIALQAQARQQSEEQANGGKATLETQRLVLQTKIDQANATKQLISAESTLATAQNAAAVQQQQAQEKLIELQREAAKNAVLSVGDVRSFFDNFITGIQQGNQKLSKIFSDFAQSLSAKFFKQMLVGKNDNFDAPIIDNVSGLFGQNGIIGAIMGQGGGTGFGAFASSFTSGVSNWNPFDSLSGLSLSTFTDLGSRAFDAFKSGLGSLGNAFSGSGSGGGGGFLSGISRLFDGGSSSGTFGLPPANTVPVGGWQIAPPGTYGGIPASGTSAVTNQAPGISGLSLLGKGFGAGILGNQIGGIVNDLFGVGKSKQGQLGGTIGSAALGAVGFAIAGPIGAAIGSALGKILGGVIGDLFKPGRIQIEKKAIEKYFEEVFKNINFKVVKENIAAQGFQALKEGTNAALALGTLYAQSQHSTGTQGVGTTKRFAGQFLGNLNEIGTSTEGLKSKLGELAKSLGADITTLVDSINSFTKSTFNLTNFEKQMGDSQKNLAKFGATANMTAKELTDLALANGNTGSTFVTYGQLIAGAVEINTKFVSSAIAVDQTNKLLSSHFNEVVQAQGDTSDATKSLSEEIKKGNLSLEEAVIKYNELRVAAGKAGLELNDFTVDPEKIKKLVDIINELATTFDDLKKNLGEGLSSALSGNLDPSKFSQTFDQLMNDTLKNSIIKAIVAGFTEGAAVETLKPLTESINALVVDVGTGNLSLTDFSDKLNTALDENKDKIDGVKNAWIAAATAGQEVLKKFSTTNIDLQGLKGSISDALTQGLSEGLDPAKYGEKFDELFNNILKTAIISAIVQGFVQGLALETLKPMFDKFQSLLKDLSDNKISFEDFRSQFHAALDAAHGDILKLKDAFTEVGRAGNDLIKDLTSQGGLNSLTASLADALKNGLQQGLSTDPVSSAQDFAETLRVSLRNAVIDALVEGFVKGLAIETLRPLIDRIQGLFKGLSENTLSQSDFTNQFNQALSDFQPQLAAIRNTFVAVNQSARTVLESLGLWAPSLEEFRSKLNDVKEQIDQIAQRKIDIEVTLHQRLADIGVKGEALKALDVQTEFSERKLGAALAKPGVAPGTPLPDPKDLVAVQAFGKNITMAMDALRELGDQEVQRFHVLEGEINDRYQKEVEAIKKAGDAEQKAIKKSFDLQIEASKDRVKALNKEKDAQKESLDALEKQVTLAKQFQDVGNSIRDALVNLGGSGRSPVSPQAQFSFLERTADKIRGELANAPVEQQPDIIKRLSDVLQQQLNLDVFQRPSAQYKDQFNKIVGELEHLQDMAERMGGGADDLQKQLLELQKSQEETLKSIDAQIEAEQELQERLADEQQAALEAASARVEAALQAAEASRDAQIENVRQASQRILQDLARQEQELADRAEGVLLTQEDILLDQLEVLKSIDRKMGGFVAGGGSGRGTLSPGASFIPQKSNGTVLQGPLGRDLTGDLGAILTNSPGSHGNVFTTAGSAPTAPPWNPDTQPGQKWMNGKWQFVQSGADVTWDSITNQSYLHGTPISEMQVQDLIKNGLPSTTAERNARSISSNTQASNVGAVNSGVQMSAMSYYPMPPTVQSPYPSIPFDDPRNVYGAGQGGDMFFMGKQVGKIPTLPPALPPTAKKHGLQPPFAFSYAAEGFHGLVTEPHAFIVSERQPEFVDIGTQRVGGEGVKIDMSSGDINITISGNVENPEAVGRAIGRAAAEERKKELLVFMRSSAGRMAIKEAASR